jgi:hypothetical protein
MWLITLAVIVLGLACIGIGPLAAYKGFQLIRSGNLRQVKAGATVLALGIAMFLLGFMLFYCTFIASTDLH